MTSVRAALVAAVPALAIAGEAAVARATATDTYLDASRARWEETARRIWSFHEVATQETRSSALLADVLE